MMPTRDDLQACQIDQADEVNRIRSLVECVGLAAGNDIIDCSVGAALTEALDVICHDLRKLSDDMAGKSDGARLDADHAHRANCAAPAAPPRPLSRRRNALPLHGRRMAFRRRHVVR